MTDWYVVIKDKETNKVIQVDKAGTIEDAHYIMKFVQPDKSERVTCLPFNPLEELK